MAFMSEKSLEAKRHTLAHVLASVVLEKYPHAKPTIGPAIENGFYYDFDFSGGEAPGQDDLAKLTKQMVKRLPKWTEFDRKEITADEAREYFKDNPFKLELIEEIEKEGEKITFYTSGGFTDLCRGGHAENPSKDIAKDSFVLTSVAGAYWRGDQTKPMLTRIYGVAFNNKKELDAYVEQLEKAKERDHRKLGKELDLFTFSELVGPGLPLWTPKGTVLRHELDAFVWELREKHGYDRITIPHITKKALYETSGHWEKFGDELFRIETREGKEFALKPMNCPHHTQVFARRPHSYREMPKRYAETTMVYRDEQSGELGGLTRVLSITQDDSHVFCRKNQIKDEFFRIWDIIDTFYSTFGFKMRVRLSFHDPENRDAYLGNASVWEEAENALRDIAKEREVDYFEAQGEAAMYGPKLDFMATDAIGRDHQVATIQLDFNIPDRFDLTCINEDGEKERIVMIHCAVMGSLERFSAVLIEHLGGVFPLWLSPVQVKVLPIGEGHQEFAKGVREALVGAGVRTELDDSKETLGKKIRDAKMQKVPYFLVVGDNEVKDKKVTVESRDLAAQAGDGKVGEMNIEEFVEKMLDQIKNRE